MTALTAALADEFGEDKVFRPYRDVRFAKDKTPYKTHQGAFIAVAPATGYYVEISAPGVRVAAGFYHAEADTLAAVRQAVDNDLFGPELEKTLRQLAKVQAGRSAATNSKPRPAAGPRTIHVSPLRHKSITVTKDYGFGLDHPHRCPGRPGARTGAKPAPRRLDPHPRRLTSSTCS